MFIQDPLDTSQKLSLLDGKVLPTFGPAGFIPSPQFGGSELSAAPRADSTPTRPISVKKQSQVDQKSTITHVSRHSVVSVTDVHGKGEPESPMFPQNQITKANSTLLSHSEYETHYAGLRSTNQGSFLSLLFSKKDLKTSGHSSPAIQPKVIETLKPAYTVELGNKIENQLSNVKSTLDHPLPTTNPKPGNPPDSRKNILGLSPSHIVKSDDRLSPNVEDDKAAPGMATTQGVTNSRYADPQHPSKCIKLPVTSRDAIFLEQWSTFTKDGFGSLKRGLSAAFAIRDDNTKKLKLNSTPLTPEQKPVTLLPSPIIVLRRELPDHHHGNQSSLKETPIFARDPFAVGSSSHPIESEYFSPSGSPDLDSTPKAASQVKSIALLSSNSKLGPNFITFPTTLGDPSDPDGVHSWQVFLSHSENGAVEDNQMKPLDLSASERGRKLGLPISIDPASMVVTPTLLSPRPQYGRKVSDPSVPSRDNLANVVTRSRSNTTANDQLFMGSSGTFLIEPPRRIIEAPLNGPAQSSLAFPSIESSSPLWRRRAVSRLARTGKASLAQGPKMILVPGCSGSDDQDAHDLQYTTKTLSADSFGLFSSQEETTTPIRSKFNGSSYNRYESASEDGLATPKASDFARKRAAKTSGISSSPDQTLPPGSAFEIKRRDSRVSPLASDIIPHFPDPPRWVIGSPPRSEFDDDNDDDETEDMEIYIETSEEARTYDASIP